MKKNESVSIKLPANIIYSSIAVLAVEKCADSTGFLKEDVSRICLAMDEGIQHALEFGYGGPQETIQVDISRTSLGLQIAIVFHGLPLEIEQLPKYDQFRALEYGDVTGISLLLIEKLLDKTSFSIHPGGIRTLSMEKYLPVQLVSPAPPKKETTKQYQERDYELRLAQPDDAEDISRLAFQSHGAVLFSEYIYYPDRVREMINDKKMVSVVVETSEPHEILGHGALVKYAPETLVEELTFGIVDPRFRSKGCASQLAKYLERDACKRGVYAIEIFAVTNHVHSQRSVLSQGIKECGLFLECSPASHSWGKGAESDLGRIGNLMFVKYLNEFRSNILYPPTHHRQMIEHIYAARDISIQVDETTADTSIQGMESSIWTLSDLQEGWAIIGVEKYGADITTQVIERLKHACAQDIFSVQLALPLVDPVTRTITATFENMGFFFAGIGPDHQGNENLVLQYVNTPKTDYESINVHSELAKEIKEYVRAHDPRT
ncbi:MAG: GNAT family N-acetyltransferase [Desulfovibrio sp.]